MIKQIFKFRVINRIDQNLNLFLYLLIFKMLCPVKCYAKCRKPISNIIPVYDKFAYSIKFASQYHINK